MGAALSPCLLVAEPLCGICYFGPNFCSFMSLRARQLCR